MVMATIGIEGVLVGEPTTVGIVWALIGEAITKGIVVGEPITIGVVSSVWYEGEQERFGCTC